MQTVSKDVPIFQRKLKVATIVGTRPEIIKLSRVIPALDKYTDQSLIHTGQNYDYSLNEVHFKQLGLRKPDYFLESVKETAAETIGSIIAKTDKILREIMPDAVLYYGDTNSCLGVIAAKRLKIPVFHMEAGNRCFDQRVPEELNRKVVDHLSDINLTLTEHARRYLIAEGLPSERVIKIGSSMREVLNYHNRSILESEILNSLGLLQNSYFVVSSHREENVDNEHNRKKMIESVRLLSEVFDKDVIFSTHPRTQKLISHEERENLKRVNFLEPLGFIDYVKLQQNAFCVISDSGTITEESSLLNFPAVMIRETHERPEGMDVGTLIMSGLQPDRVVDSVNAAVDLFSQYNKSSCVPDYEVDDVSKKVVKIILSYTEYVNTNIWKK